MKLLTRYVLRELLVPLVVWVGLLFLLLFVMQFLRGTDVLLGSAVTGTDLLRLIGYLSPHFLVMALPIGLLLAILLGLGRLAEDRELTAMHALGIGPLQLIVAPLLLGALLGGAMMLLAFTAEPWGLASVRSLVNEVIKKNVVGDVKSGVFYEDLTQLTLYAEQVDRQNQRWTHVLLHDGRDPASPLLVLARKGKVNAAGEDEALKLELSEGWVHRAQGSGPEYATVSFEEGMLSVGIGDSLSRKNRFRSPKEELTPLELRETAIEAEKAGEDSRSWWSAYWTRLSQALAPLAFALVGAPLAMRRRESGRSRGFLFTIIAYVAFFVLSRLFENMGQHGTLPIVVSAFLPAALFFALGGVLIFQMVRRGGAR